MFQKLYRYGMPVLKTSRFRHLFRFVAFSAYPLCGLKRRPQRLLAEPVEATIFFPFYHIMKVIPAKIKIKLP